MKNEWSKPSLSRDFALLAAAILLVLFLISAWVSYATYAKHSKYIEKHLEEEAKRIEKLLAYDMHSANYMLTSLGRQIIINRNYDLTTLAQILKSFDNRGYVYSVFSYIDEKQRVIVSSNKGVLEKPVDISDRDYVAMAAGDPWNMHIGAPIDGRVSGRWVIPVVMGLSDATGKFIGSLLISLDINLLVNEIAKIMQSDGLTFSILSTNLTSPSKDPQGKDFDNSALDGHDLKNSPSGMSARGSLLFGTTIYTYHYTSPEFPYIIAISYDSGKNDESVRNQLWSRLLQVLGFAAFFVLFLWIMRARIISPIISLTESASDIAKGKHFRPTPHGGAIEIDGLSAQMGNISEYISEKDRIEDELRNKMFLLKKEKEHSDRERKIQTEFLSYICQELRDPANNVVSFAKVMKDQLYGPIENRKYRQYAADIYQSGNQMLANLSDLLSFSKIRDEYTALKKYNVDPAAELGKAVARVQENNNEPPAISVKAQDGLPQLVVSPFILQQIIYNLLSYIIHILPKTEISVEIIAVNENKDNPLVAFIFSTSGLLPASRQEIAATAERLFDAYQYQADIASAINIEGSLSLELAKALVHESHAGLDIYRKDSGIQLMLIFGRNQIQA